MGRLDVKAWYIGFRLASGYISDFFGLYVEGLGLMRGWKSGYGDRLKWIEKD